MGRAPPYEALCLCAFVALVIDSRSVGIFNISLSSRCPLWPKIRVNSWFHFFWLRPKARLCSRCSPSTTLRTASVAIVPFVVLLYRRRRQQDSIPLFVGNFNRRRFVARLCPTKAHCVSNADLVSWDYREI